MLCSGHLNFGLVQGFHKLRQNAYLDLVVALVCASCYHQVVMASLSTVSPVKGSCFGRGRTLNSSSMLVMLAGGLSVRSLFSIDNDSLERAILEIYRDKK